MAHGGDVRVGGLGSHPLRDRKQWADLELSGFPGRPSESADGAGHSAASAPPAGPGRVDAGTLVADPEPVVSDPSVPEKDADDAPAAGSRPRRALEDPSDPEAVEDWPEPWKFADGVSLRPWQADAVTAWENAGHAGIVQAVTGTGKTMVGIAAISAALDAGLRCVVLVPTITLRTQWVAALAETLPEADVVGDPKEFADWHVLVCTVQTAMNHQYLLARQAGMVIADECHRCGSPKFSRALRDHYEWRLGLSATVERGDEGDQVIGRYFSGICFDLRYDRAVAEGLIAPYDVALVGVPLGDRERVRYEKLTDALTDVARALRSRTDIPEEPFPAFISAVNQLANDRGSRYSRLARKYLADFSNRKKLLAASQMKYRVIKLLEPVVRGSHGALVFTQTKESAERAADILGNLGISSGAVHSGQDSEQREERLYEFAAGETKALAAPRILDEGVDVPEADLGIVVASNNSRRQMIQRMGRVLRVKRDGGPARFAVLYGIGTVEDPHHTEEMPAFYRECLPWARRSAEFDLSGKGQAAALIGFLGADPNEGKWDYASGSGSRADEHPATTARTSPASAATPMSDNDLGIGPDEPATAITAAQRKAAGSRLNEIGAVLGMKTGDRLLKKIGPVRRWLERHALTWRTCLDACPDGISELSISASELAIMTRACVSLESWIPGPSSRSGSHIREKDAGHYLQFLWGAMLAIRSQYATAYQVLMARWGRVSDQAERFDDIAAALGIDERRAHVLYDWGLESCWTLMKGIARRSRPSEITLRKVPGRA